MLEMPVEKPNFRHTPIGPGSLGFYTVGGDYLWFFSILLWSQCSALYGNTAARLLHSHDWRWLRLIGCYIFLVAQSHRPFFVLFGILVAARGSSMFLGWQLPPGSALLSS